MKNLVNVYHAPGMVYAVSLPEPMTEKDARAWVRSDHNLNRLPNNTTFWFFKLE